HDTAIQFGSSFRLQSFTLGLRRVHMVSLYEYRRTVGVWREDQTIFWNVDWIITGLKQVLAPAWLELLATVWNFNIGVRRPVLIVCSTGNTFYEDQHFRVNRVDGGEGFFRQGFPILPGVIPWLVENVDTDDVINA